MLDNALRDGFVFHLSLTRCLCLFPSAARALLVTQISYPAILDELTSWHHRCIGRFPKSPVKDVLQGGWSAGIGGVVDG